MEDGVKSSLKRPLSFSDDSFEWDCVRDENPAEDAWRKPNVDCHENVTVDTNGLPVDWIPYGYVRSRKGKKPRLEQSAPPPAVKKAATDTLAKLEDPVERDVAKEILLSISKYCGSFVFESSDKDTYGRLVPFPVDNASTKMGANDDWQLDKFDCKLESLLTNPPSKKVQKISFPPWKGAKQRERKHEVTHVKRESKLEDITIEDELFSWTTFANLVKPQLAAMEPKARYEAAKKFSDILQGDLSATSATVG